jgi:hypothetical protein
MRILIHNYLSESSTEPLALLNAALRSGFDVKFWDNNQVSAYDIFDEVDPNILITSDTLISQDLLNRLTESSCKLAINTSFMLEEESENFNKYINNLAPTYIYRNPKFADVFLQTDRKQRYTCDKLVLPYAGAKIAVEGQHHVVSYMRADVNNSDMYLPIAKLPEIYHCYKEIYCTENNQTLFDAAYFGGVSISQNVKVSREDIAKYFNPFNLLSEIFEQLGLDSSDIGAAKDVFFSEKF